MMGAESWPSKQDRGPSGLQAKFVTPLLCRVISWISRSRRRPKPLAKISPQISEKNTIRPTLDGTFTFPHWTNRTILLPGGRHILFSGWDSVHCWAVETDVLVWSYQVSSPASVVRSFAVELVNDGKNVIFVICFKNQSHENIADIVDLDLETGISETRLTVHFSTSHYYASPSICGDIATISIHRAPEYILINWRTKSCCKLSPRVGSGLSLRVVADYMVIAKSTNGLEATAHVTICAIAALSPHWHPSEESPTIEPVSVDTLPIILSRPFPLPRTSKSRPAKLEMDLHESPLQPRVYRLWVYTQWSASARMVRCSYHVVLDRTGVKLNPRSESIAQVRWHWEQHVWYSGHRLTYMRDQYRISPPGLELGHSVALSAHHYLLDVAPYGGALILFIFAIDFGRRKASTLDKSSMEHSTELPLCNRYNLSLT
ncbi:hypothetical protein C8R44DRAFT_858355 [Mycena epipterygia]|nr:hypothetical protein C8R44DRAFT_858355 [Mycena epipterygia]